MKEILLYRDLAGKVFKGKASLEQLIEAGRGDILNGNFSLGERLRKLRQAGALSQEQVANLAGIVPAYLGQVERGEKNITVRTLEKVCNALDITLSEFFNIAKEHDKCIDAISNQILHHRRNKQY